MLSVDMFIMTSTSKLKLTLSLQPQLWIKQFHLSCCMQKKRPVKLKSKHSHSSQQWLQRQMKDPFVQQAKLQNYRARSAFKLLDINNQHHILTPGSVVIDCGAAPGSWTQVAVNKVNSLGQDPTKPKGKVIAVDLLFIDPIDGAVIINKSDFTHDDTQKQILTHLEGKSVDLVMSDMAPNASGIQSMDHDNIVQLCRTALTFSKLVLRPKAAFLCKLWDGYETGNLKRELGSVFQMVKIIRPNASRKESSEIYLLAKGFHKH
ncbi:rRNA methyltransferase 2, mitochondrial-like [Amphiura filiformis]|uniref:rRNA methyltransferase 2, mitochondrial-like n=1 Tax=Amphiura filiformis TaxID=82378 RepID=UPI003B21B669